MLASALTHVWNLSLVTISPSIKAAQNHQTFKLDSISWITCSEGNRSPGC